VAQRAHGGAAHARIGVQVQALERRQRGVGLQLAQGLGDGGHAGRSPRCRLDRVEPTVLIPGSLRTGRPAGAAPSEALV